jgi:hypothetical protein
MRYVDLIKKLKEAKALRFHSYTGNTFAGQRLYTESNLPDQRCQEAAEAIEALVLENETIRMGMISPAENTVEGISIGSTWRHRSGGVYLVYDFTNLDSQHVVQYPARVSYVGENGKRWSGSLYDWHRRMTKEEA